MSDTAIHIENLSKRYIINHERERTDGLRHAMERAVRSPFRWLRSGFGPGAPTTEEFWALRDLNLEIKQGEAVGIIGKNGAGKSTLLKILSRITEPTTGRIRLRGRVASLLEVGTGFHPELTGRENIFLNGAILGMTRAEIATKFDAIVAFAETEKFLDTPVKRYSSGMYVRLAFAVAAHLEPEILIIDEVLAVGDAQFQAKCLGKMDDVSRQEGRTVLFVSHNMHAVSSLTSRCVLLRGGRNVLEGAPETVIGSYMEDTGGERRSAHFIPIPTSGWKVLYTSSQEPGWAATQAFDGNPYTFWHTEFSNSMPPPPHEIQIDLGQEYVVSGFRVLPRQDGNPNGRIANYEFYVSSDGRAWGSPLSTGLLANRAGEQEVLFTSTKGRFVRLLALREMSNLPFVCVTNLTVLTPNGVGDRAASRPPAAAPNPARGTVGFGNVPGPLANESIC